MNTVRAVTSRFHSSCGTKKNGWSISELHENIDFGNLLHADPMLCYLHKLKCHFVHIEDTGEEMDEYVELDAKPECDWS